MKFQWSRVFCSKTKSRWGPLSTLFLNAPPNSAAHSFSCSAAIKTFISNFLLCCLFSFQVNSLRKSRTSERCWQSQKLVFFSIFLSVFRCQIWFLRLCLLWCASSFLFSFKKDNKSQIYIYINIIYTYIYNLHL